MNDRMREQARDEILRFADDEGLIGVFAVLVEWLEKDRITDAHAFLVQVAGNQTEIDVRRGQYARRSRIRAELLARAEEVQS